MTHDVYAPRPVSFLGVWSFPGLDLKAYGLSAEDRPVTDAMEETGRGFVRDDVLPSMKALGDSNGLGFAIIHPGTAGLSIPVHWWTQGSVLCQRFFRQLYGADVPLNMTERPSIGCVWELGIVTEETRIWRDTMMSDAPDKGAYLARPVDVTSV
ncbi:MAG: hypothetical protein AAF280_09815 [Pseudomonadota bacterium]